MEFQTITEENKESKVIELTKLQKIRYILLGASGSLAILSLGMSWYMLPSREEIAKQNTVGVLKAIRNINFKIDSGYISLYDDDNCKMLLGVE